MEAYGDSLENENIGIVSGENQLREDLAEAMLETSAAPHRGPGKINNIFIFFIKKTNYSLKYTQN